jgi:hypothetical protein
MGKTVVDRRRAGDTSVSGLLLDDDPLVVTRAPRRRRRRMPRATRPLCFLALAAGGLGVSVGVAVQSTPQEAWRLSMTPGTALTVPARVPLAGPLVVFGTPRDGSRPTLAELGCQVTEGGGPIVLPDEANENHLVVANRGVVPLAAFPGRPGHSIACSGPAADDAAPLYLAPGHSSRDLVPVASYSVAALLLPAGAVGLLAARAAGR